MAKEEQKYQELRKKAENLLDSLKKEGRLDILKENIKDLNELSYELQVHQVELDMQNKELRSSQKSLEESHDELNDLYDFAPVGYATLDQNGMVIQANLTLAQMLETERSKILNSDFHEYVSYFDRDKLYLHLKEVFQSGSPKQTELWITSQKGQQICALLQSQKTEQNNKNPQCRVAISNITKLKNTEESLTAEKNTNAAHNTLFSNISHNLINTLQDLNSLSTTIYDKFYTFENFHLKSYIGNISKKSKNAYDLLHNLLVWSLSEKGIMPFTPVKINLQEKVNEIIRMEISLNDKNHKIKNLIHQDTRVKADDEMLNTIIRNLLSNAIKHSPHGSTITIGCRSYDRASLLIYVKDEGTGMDEDVQTKIFDKNQIYTSKGTDDEKGFGLGLILCQEFIAKNGGNIWLESKPGKGSTFYFTLFGKTGKRDAASNQ